MSSSLIKICGLGALVVCVTCVTLSEAQAGGRRHACHCQQQYAAPAATAVPAADMAHSGSTTRYQSAYQAPAASNNSYYGNSSSSRSTRSYWDQQTQNARHIKGL